MPRIVFDIEETRREDYVFSRDDKNEGYFLVTPENLDIRCLNHVYHAANPRKVTAYRITNFKVITNVGDPEE